MSLPKPKQLKKAFRLIPASKITLHRRLMLYLFSAMCAFVALILLLLNLFNVLNPIGGTFERVLNQQLEVSMLQIQHDLDELSARVEHFSSQLSTQLQQQLKASRLSFNDLQNNGEALSALQSATFPPCVSIFRWRPAAARSTCLAPASIPVGESVLQRPVSQICQFLCGKHCQQSGVPFPRFFFCRAGK